MYYLSVSWHKTDTNNKCCGKRRHMCQVWSKSSDERRRMDEEEKRETVTERDKER